MKTINKNSVNEIIIKNSRFITYLIKLNKPSIDEKLKKRQEIQKQITDLNNQLRQYQFEQERKKQQEKRLAKEQSNEVKKEIIGSKEKGLSQESMNTLISADSAVGQIKIQENRAYSNLLLETFSVIIQGGFSGKEQRYGYYSKAYRRITGKKMADRGCSGID